MVLLAFSVVFGGASREHALRLALVELAALPLLVISCRALMRSGQWRHHRYALALVLGLLLLPLLQLVPLPPAIWTALPGRSDLELAVTLSGVPVSWAALSLTPEQTWRATLALLPPVAMFLGVLSASPVLRHRIIWIYLFATAAAVGLGVLQLSSGGDRYYLWETTAAGRVVGFFANRNHLATLLLASLPFAAVLTGAAVRARTDRDKMVLWLGTLYIGLAIVAVGVVRSRAGVVLAGPVLAATLLAGWIAIGRGRPKPALLAMGGAMAAALTAVVAFGLAPIMASFDTGEPEGRFENWPVVIEAAQTYLPIGAGVGSFDPVYRSVEPLERLDSTYFNQAHNDFLEIWLETGWLGVALLGAFLIWFGGRSWRAWLGASSESNLQRAASLAILVVLAHSAVDYPLRTETMAVFFAMCAAILEGRARATPPLERSLEK